MRFRLLYLVAPLVLVLSSGCGAGSLGVALLTSPPLEQMRFTKSEPENPYVQVGAGPLARSTFATTEAGYAIEVRDLLFGPAQKAVDVDLNGAAMIEVRDGAGIVTIGGKTREVAMGATLTVSEGEKLRIEARGGSLVLRAYVFRAEQ